MTGLKIAFYTILTTGGLSTAMTGVILGSIPSSVQAATADAVTTIAPQASTVVNSTTPITLALAMGGMSLAATFGWKISRAWSQMEGKVSVLEERLASIEDKCYRGVPGANCPR